MIGIIGAMTMEIDGIKSAMTDVSVKKTGGMEFVCGTFCGCRIVAAVCGEGKVNAAMCAQAMIMEYHPDFIVNTGVGGGLAECLHIGDIVVATSVVEHDMDMSPLGYERGYVCGTDCIYMECDSEISKKLCRCVSNRGLSYIKGVVASGDQFISSDDKKKWLVDTFNAVVCEMEGAAIGHVCIRNNVPFGVLRAVSDGGDDDAKLSFPEFASMAAANSIRIISDFAESCAKTNSASTED